MYILHSSFHGIPSDAVYMETQIFSPLLAKPDLSARARGHVANLSQHKRCQQEFFSPLESSRR